MSQEIPYNQPTSEPTPKVVSAGIGGAITSILLWVAQQFFAIDPPAEVGAAIATIIAFISAYMTRDRKPPEAVEAITQEQTLYKG